MFSVTPISADVFVGLPALDIRAGTVNDRFIAMRRGALSGVVGAGEEYILLALMGNEQ